MTLLKNRVPDVESENITKTVESQRNNKDSDIMEKDNRERKILWHYVFLLTILHIAAVYGLMRIFQARLYTIMFLICYYIFGAIGVGSGAHRLWCHRSYKAKTPLRIMMALMNAATLQNDIVSWSEMHRVHHKFTDTDADPYTMTHGFIHCHIGWLWHTLRDEYYEKKKLIDFSDLYDDKVAMIQSRFYMPIAVVMALIVPTLVPWYFWGESISNGFFLNFVRIVVAYQAVLLINSVTHAWGKRPYDKDISATENLFTSFFSVGEGFHNYHHTFPQDYRASEHGWFLNGSGAFIDIMAFFGQVTDRKMASSDIIEQRKQRTGDRSLKSDF